MPSCHNDRVRFGRGRFAGWLIVSLGLVAALGKAIHALGEKARGSCLPSSAWTSEEIGVRYTILCDRFFQGTRNMRLSFDLIERTWAVLEIEGLCRHCVGNFEFTINRVFCKVG